MRTAARWHSPAFQRAAAVAEPEFTGMEWYGGYMERHANDGTAGAGTDGRPRRA